LPFVVLWDGRTIDTATNADRSMQTQKKILCIEDDRETAALIAEELVDRGYARRNLFAHLSPRQLGRAFQAETGQTPAKAIENLRLEEARALMEDTNHTIEVVAQLTGFGDRDRMRRAFLRAYDNRPT
jgi:AraC-like DNA-binding protein